MNIGSKFNARHGARRHKGFSLIEVLVALFVISLSALGTAGLQTVAVRMNNNALLESQASTLAQDIIERIRANPGGDYTTAFDATNLAISAPPCIGPAANCSSDEMAQYDLVEWKCALGIAAIRSVCDERGISAQLPEGDGSIDVVANTFVINIRWFNSATGTDKQIVFTALI